MQALFLLRAILAGPRYRYSSLSTACCVGGWGNDNGCGDLLPRGHARPRGGGASGPRGRPSSLRHRRRAVVGLARGIPRRFLPRRFDNPDPQAQGAANTVAFVLLNLPVHSISLVRLGGAALVISCVFVVMRT